MTAKKKSKSVNSVKVVDTFDFNTFREKLALLEREQWNVWALNILAEESKITKKRRERWEKYFQMNWEDLPDSVKESDFEFADKVIAMFSQDPFDNLLFIGKYILDVVYPEDTFFGSSEDVGVQYIDAMRQAFNRIMEIRAES